MANTETKAPSQKTPRERLHHGIRRTFTSAIASHYKTYPHWFDDERGRKGVSALLALMHDILNVVDDFAIREKTDKPDACE
jgi:hypothetical protein